MVKKEDILDVGAVRFGEKSVINTDISNVIEEMDTNTSTLYTVGDITQDINKHNNNGDFNIKEETNVESWIKLMMILGVNIFCEK